MTASLGAKERAAMCDTLDGVGPDVATLCEGWSSFDMAAHLYVRERDPFAGPGIILPGPFARLTEHRMAAAKKKGYAALVQTIRRGPPLHWRLVPDGVHLVEYFVHHEDVRRAQGDERRPADGERDDGLWSWLIRGAGRFYARRARGGLDVQLPDGRHHRLKKSGEPSVTIVGEAGEIVLFLHGRKDAARVDFEGPADAVTDLRSTDFGV